MKVIIELNDNLSLENIEDCENEVKIVFKNHEGMKINTNIVTIDEFKLALRKLSAK